MKCKSQLLVMLLIFGMSSCISYEKYQIEVFKPAAVTLPADFRTVAIVSRNLKYYNDTLQQYQVRNYKLIKDQKRFNIDSLAIKNCIESLATSLKSKNKFDTIIQLPVNAIPQTRVNEIRFAAKDWYNVLCKQANTDGLIILDMYSGFYSKNNRQDYNPLAHVISSNIWSVYNAKTEKIIDRYTQIDTLYWDGTDDRGRYNKNSIPDKLAAIEITSGIVGKKYSKRLLADWVEVQRNIATGNQFEFRKAAELAKQNRWDDAVVIWENLLQKKNKQKQFIALYNLALAHEMKGDISKSIELAGKAAKASSGMFMKIENDAAREYSVILYRRQNELLKLQSLENVPD